MKFRVDWMRGSYFIVQTSNFLQIDATVVTLGQRYGNVIRYILQTYIFFDLAQTILTWKAKVFAAADAAGGAETN